MLPCFFLTICAGCRQGGDDEASVNAVGTYTLVSVDGKPVPCSVEHDGRSLTVKSGAFTISADGTCATKTSFTTPEGSEANREVKASYTQKGSTLTMKWEGAGSTTGTIEGNTFTMNNEGMIFSYRK